MQPYEHDLECIPKSSLPPLPAGWCGPWEADGVHLIDKSRVLTFKGHYRIEIVGNDLYESYEFAKFLCKLLNVTHPAPTKVGE